MGRTVRGGKCTCLIEYSPLPSQLRFHQSEARFRGFSGPIGSGKSKALCHEAIKLSYLNQGRCGLLGAPTYPMLRDSTQTALLETLESNRIPFTLQKSENVIVMKDTGSKILLRSLEEFERLRGTNLSWFAVDELTYAKEGAWTRLEGRLRDPGASRLGGFAVWTPKGHDWVYERFLKNPPPGYEVVIAKAMENRHVLDKVPDYYERLKHSYDEKFFQQEVMGEYLNATENAVYHAFEREVNVKEIEIEPSLMLMWALDFNVDPMSSLVVQIVGDRVHVLDEIVLSRASTTEACEEFINRHGAHQKGFVVYGDASGSARMTSGDSDYELVKKYLRSVRTAAFRYRIPTKNPPVRDRVATVNARLKNAAGEVNLFVHPKCKELIKDLEEVVYVGGSSLIDKKDGRRTHLSDALGYLVWQEFFGKCPAGDQKGPLF